MANAYQLSDITQLVRKHFGSRNQQFIASDTLARLGADGDDVVEFMEEYAQAFGVNMDAYLWYFHHHEENSGFGGMLAKTASEQVERIEISMQLLLDCANAGRWIVEYPEHLAPDTNAQDGINLFVAYLAVAVIIVVSVLVLYAWVYAP